jgi:hypothetical protein
MEVANGGPTPPGNATGSAGRKVGPADTYTAVVYFHGIGNQRRYTEVSRLVEALDRYAYVHRDKRKGRGSGLRGTEVRLEPSRADDDQEVAFVALNQYRPGSKEVLFRFYEGYWAPITAGGVSAREVAFWVLRHALTPLRILLTPWRSHARLRRAALYAAATRWRTSSDPSPTTLKRLLHAYDDFEGLDARREFPKGSFDDFLRYLTGRRFPLGSKRDESLRGARAWRRYQARSLLAVQFLALTLLLALGLGLMALLVGIVWLLEWLGGTSLATEPGIASMIEPTPANIAAVAAILFGASGISAFLRGDVGDVLLWATYEETDTRHRVRREILQSGVDLLRHVITDPKCARVVVVAHSLGTTIAYDCLLELGRYYRARKATDPSKAKAHGAADDSYAQKFDQFITLGSPIDAVHAIFESHRSRSHRYNRVYEDVRGDIGEVPFTYRRRPIIHWVNFWDPGDPISAPLYTPNEKLAKTIPIDNYEVSSLRFPSPGGSHSAYFEDNGVLGFIFQMIVYGRYSFHGEGSPSTKRLNKAGRSHRLMFYQGLMLMIPWIVAAYLAARALGLPSLSESILLLAAVAAVTIVLVGWLLGWIRGPRNSIWRIEQAPPIRN